MPTFTAIGAIVGSDWATAAAVEETRSALAEAGAVEPELAPGDYLVDVRFDFEAEDETDAQDVAHRVMTQAATSFGWMVTEIVPA